MNTVKRGEYTSIKDVFLHNQGIASLEEMNDKYRKFQNGTYHIDGISGAVKLARKFKNETVTVLGDYDCDGVTSTTILVRALKMSGFTDVRYRIPKRFTEGFGVNKTMIDEIQSGLIITCDNGIAQVDVIEYAKAKGLSVIVTDHHEPLVIDGEVIFPPADFIIDPVAIKGQADFDGYCGAGLAYRFARELLKDAGEVYKTLIPYAAIGTIADVMELKEENYCIVKNGLDRLNTANPYSYGIGLYALTCALGIKGHVTAHDVSFGIGPCINAVSRLADDGANEAVKLLCFDGSYEIAVGMAEAIKEKNDSRKKIESELTKMAEQVISDECLYGEIPLLVNINTEHEGLLGIIAGRLSRKYNVPCIVTAPVADNPSVLKGSARSVGNFNIKAALDSYSNLLLGYGGHEAAAGLSFPAENLDALREALAEQATGFEVEKSVTVYDLEIESSDLFETTSELSKYEPWGNGNPAPVFKVNNFSLVPRGGTKKKLMGADESHIKLFSSKSVAIGFGLAERFEKIELQAQAINLIGTVSVNFFGNTSETQVEFTDFEVMELAKKETPLAGRLRSLAMAK